MAYPRLLINTRHNVVKNTFSITILLFVCSMVVGCGRPTITLRVLDEQTKEPIEGAVAIAWWDSSHGLPGLTYHKTAEVAERISDSDGKLTLPYFSTKTIPQIRVYKPGYVGWDNFVIYKGYMYNNMKTALEEKRKGFQYKSQDIYLERWKDEYSHISHQNFLESFFPNDHKDIDADKSLFSRTLREFEQPLVDGEREMLRKKDKK